MSEFRFVKLGELTKIKTGKLDANASSEDGQYPFFTCSREPLRIATYSYDCECVLVAGNGDLNVKYYSGKFDAYQRTYIIESVNSQILYVPYLFVFLDKYVERLREQAIGGVIKYIKLGNLTDAIIPLPLLEHQKKISEILDKVSNLISSRKKQIEKLDLLVKSRFVEMFGDLGNNSKGWNVSTIIDTCRASDDIKCGPFGTQLGKAEYVLEGIPVWGIPQINSAFKIWPTDYVTSEKAKILKQYTIIQNDIVMTRKGDVGKCAIYPPEYPNGILHSDAIRIRTDRNILNAVFLTSQLHQSAYVKHQIEVVSSGAIMAGVNVSKLKQMKVHVPPIDLQNQFATFVQQVEKQKSKLKQSLEKLELTYKALMQKYFA